MKLVLLDNDTIGNDINLSEIEKFGELTKFPMTYPHQTSERIKNAEIVITNKVVIGSQELENCENLKLICVAATGYNNIDIQACREKNITVLNVKGYSTFSVAQHVFANILAIYNSVFQYQNLMSFGAWERSETFTMLNNSIVELRNKKLGIIGYGEIGKQVANIAEAFGMQLLISERKGSSEIRNGRVNFENVLAESDILTIHTPLLPETENLISAKELKKMKQSAILINMARGGIVNETDLYNSLKNNEIKFAIVDVLTQEPPKDGNKLLGLSNTIITPHIAWTSVEARKTLVQGIAQNITDFLLGKAVSL